MKRFFVCLGVLFYTAVSNAQDEDEPLLNKADVHALIREAAVKIEQKFKVVNAEADSLLERVEETLALPKPPEADKNDRNQLLASKMTLLTVQSKASANLSGIRGFVFDDSSIGYMQRYHDLEATNTSDAEEVLRWLEMKEAAEHLKWQDKEAVSGQRALGAARALIEREPKNAEAQALLAGALDWKDGADKLASLRAALKLDPKQPRALEMLLDRRIEKALEVAALRREYGLEEQAPKDANRALYEQPLLEEEVRVFEKNQNALKREADQLLSLALARGSLATYLKILGNLAIMRGQTDLIEAASKRAPDDSFEDFQKHRAMLLTNQVFTLIEKEEHMRGALQLADENPEAMGTIMLISMIGDAMNQIMNQKTPAPGKAELIETALAKLINMANADDSLKAARASEAVAVAEFMRLMMGKKPEDAKMLLRTIRLDPFRHRTLGLLMAYCMFSSNQTGCYALTQMQLALLPNFETRRMCAAAATSLHDWPAAHRYLETCLREKQDDVSLMNQRAATLLRENQSKATQKKAAMIYDKIEPLLKEQAANLTKDERHDLLRNRVLFLCIYGKNDEAKSALAAAIQSKAISEDDGKELEKFLR